ncbi:MAG: hypothetical protein ABFD08_15375 [Syntrophomonas sp.]
MEHKCPTCGHKMAKRTTNSDFFSSVAIFFPRETHLDQTVTWECQNPECEDFKIEKSVQEETEKKK